MGRKPNQLIVEFFDRGQKLDDTSNRYAYDCKLCGEHFPKGRNDTLKTHISKKCMAMDQVTRVRVLRRLHDLPDLNVGYHGGSTEDTEYTSLNAQQNGYAMQLPTENQSFDNLEILAEASRRIEMPMQNDNLEAWSTAPDHDTFSGIRSNLSMIAASASNLEASRSLGPYQNFDTSNDNTSEPSHLSMHLSNLPSTNFPKSSMSTDEEANAALYPFHIASKPKDIPQTTQNSNSGYTKPYNQQSGQRIRGGFSEARKVEIQDVRRMGACIRCRMLRKTCDGETPCKGCQTLMNARRWKIPCIRTHLHKETELFTSGLYQELAWEGIGDMVMQVHQERYPGFIKMSHDLNFTFFLALEANTGLPRALQEAENGAHIIKIDKAVTFVNEAISDTPAKLRGYIKDMAPSFFEQEPSTAIRSSLIMTSQIGDENQDKLLYYALQLWAATHILVDSEMIWKIHLQPSQAPSSDSTKDSSTAVRIPINEMTHPESQSLICTHLREAAEKVVAEYSRTVMDVFEKRIERIPKGHGSGFETFLGAVIFLASLEKMYWLFQFWQQDYVISKWPKKMEHGPDHYLKQADKFLDFVCGLLSMRNIPLQTKTEPEDGLLHLNHSIKTVHQKSFDDAASEWLTSVQLTRQYVEERNTAVFDPHNSRSLEFKFISRLLI